MLPVRDRLRRRRDFARVYKTGQTHHAGIMSVKAMPNHREGSRLAVVVSTKISKKAVVRNRIRRRIMALIREMWPQVAPGYDIIVIVRQDIHRAPIAEIREALTRCLKALRVLH